MKVLFTILTLVTVTACTEKKENVYDAGVDPLIVKMQSIDKDNYVITYQIPKVCEDLPEDFDETLQKLVEEARKNSFCRDN